MSRTDGTTNVRWDDGWRPSSAKLLGITEQKMCIKQPIPKKIGFAVRDGALEPSLLAKIYDAAVGAAGPLGCYVTTPKMLAARRTGKLMVSPKDIGTKDEPLAKLAAEIIHQLFCVPHTDAESGKVHPPLLERSDLRLIHGFSLWCLCSELNQQVHYHIDYAEVVRHLTGTTTPPVYGAVLHCSDFENGAMAGGDFAANTRGLDHYEEWGFKAKLIKKACATKMGFSVENKVPVENKVDIAGKYGGGGSAVGVGVAQQGESEVPGFNELEEARKEEGWEFVDYRTNRFVLMDGDLPHMSTPVQSLPDGKRRVILGINIFGHNVGCEAEQFPDHAERSNRVVSMLQAFGRTTTSKGRQQLMQLMQARIKGKNAAKGDAAAPVPPAAE